MKNRPQNQATNASNARSIRFKNAVSLVGAVCVLIMLVFVAITFRFGQQIYSFTMVGQNGNSVLSCVAVKIVFEEAPFTGKSEGEIDINGWGWSKKWVGEEKRPFEESSFSGITKVTYAGYTVSFAENGTKLVYGANIVDLKDGKKTVLLHRNGSLTIIRGDEL